MTQMGRLLQLAAEMLRYRVAVMIWMFMLLGAAHHGVESFPVADLVALTVALAASYIAATTVNDIADEEIDKVNHPAGRGRPLVQGRATAGELWQVNAAAAAVALVAGSYVGWRGIAVVAASLAIGYAYSVRPWLISHRTWLAAPVLTIAYVLAPYLHGLALADAAPSAADAVFALGLCSLFLSRIVLKDFRDRAGDAAFDKPTPLLRLGKNVTCRISAAALLVGCALVAVALRGDPVIFVLVIAFGATIAAQLRSLRLSEDVRSEQVAIGIGARMGNGLLVCVLAALLLDAQSAPAVLRVAGVLLVAAPYTASYLALVRSPESVVIGYKG